MLVFKIKCQWNFQPTLFQLLYCQQIVVQDFKVVDVMVISPQNSGKDMPS